MAFSRRNLASMKSDYELLREKNIREKQEMLAKLMGDLKDFFPQAKKQEQQTPLKRKRPQRSAESSPFMQHRYGLKIMRAEPPVTRSRRASLSSSTCSSPSRYSSASSPFSSPRKLVVRFPFFTKKQNNELDGKSDEEQELEVFMSDEESNDYEPEEWEYNEPKRSRIGYFNTTEHIVIPVSEITSQDLDNVATYVKEKVYDSVNGTSCHQCRQKTRDMKSLCRSEECHGVRGRFCGPCLRNRYGEDVREALLDPNWICPPCRGICNCSFCRKKAGYDCTGIMIHLARENGYSSVKEYLEENED